jgi:hypothetical protein
MPSSLEGAGNQALPKRWAKETESFARTWAERSRSKLEISKKKERKGKERKGKGKTKGRKIGIVNTYGTRLSEG